MSGYQPTPVQKASSPPAEWEEAPNRVSSAIEALVQAIASLVESNARLAESNRMLVGSIADLLGEETGRPEEGDENPMSTLDG